MDGSKLRIFDSVSYICDDDEEGPFRRQGTVVSDTEYSRILVVEDLLLLPNVAPPTKATVHSLDRDWCQRIPSDARQGRYLSGANINRGAAIILLDHPNDQIVLDHVSYKRNGSEPIGYVLYNLDNCQHIFHYIDNDAAWNAFVA